MPTRSAERTSFFSWVRGAFCQIDSICRSRSCPRGHDRATARPPSDRFMNPSSMIDRRWPGGARADRGSWCTATRFALLLAGLICAAYPDVVFGGRVFYFRDFGFFGYPLAHHHHQSFWQGEIPLWNPYNNCGLPFLAQWNTLVLYPGSLAYLLVPPAWSLSFFCLVHLWLAGMGMYCLACRWTGHRLGAAVAGVAFALSGLALNSLMWPNNVAALGWMPWVVLLCERSSRGGKREWVKAAVVGAMQMLAGAPEIILFTWFIAGSLVLVRDAHGDPGHGSRMLRFGWVAGMVAALAAAQLLPFLDLLRHSERHQDFGVSTWAMPGTGWANLLVPLFYCYRGRYDVFFQPNQNWTSSYYPGIGVVALAVVGFLLRRESRVWLLAGIGLLGLLLAPGDQSLAYAGLRALVPQVGFMRFPIKFVVLTLFVLPPLAAWGIKQILWSVSARAPGPRRAVIGVGLGLTLAIAGLLCFARLQPPPWGGWRDTACSGISRACFLWAVLGGLVGIAGMARRRGAGPLSLGLVTLVALDLLTHTSQQNPTVSRVAFFPGAVRLTPRPKLGESRAMMSPTAYRSYVHTFTTRPLNDYVAGRAGLFNNANLVEDIPEVGGFFSLYFPEERALWHSLYRRQTLEDVPHLLDFLGVSQLTRPGPIYEFEHRANALPWVTAGQRPVFADAETAARVVRDGVFNLGEVVILPPASRQVVTVTNRTSARVVASEVEPLRVTVRVEAPAPSLVVIAQTDSPHWRAFIDGRKTPGLHANHAFMAVQVPAGRHVVRLVYWDSRFHTGVVISTLMLVGCLVAVRAPACAALPAASRRSALE
jgi:hypothetical protein